jgi:hypothetical protein
MLGQARGLAGRVALRLAVRPHPMRLCRSNSKARGLCAEPCATDGTGESLVLRGYDAHKNG